MKILLHESDQFSFSFFFFFQKFGFRLEGTWIDYLRLGVVFVEVNYVYLFLFCTNFEDLSPNPFRFRVLFVVRLCVYLIVKLKTKQKDCWSDVFI
uniref:Uncharacterized protein n=1 Tax=Noccaea caerulescens TaxID=107243 RepID=A0A1J3CHE8_NOCCA